MSRAAMLALSIAALGACDGKPAEPSGIGKWRFGHTTLHDVADGICQPTDLNDGRKGTWCFAQTPLKIAKSTAELDLYFLGTEKTAPLIELQLRVRGCHEADVEEWMRAAFGPPIESKSTRVYWKNAFLWAAAMLPSEPGRCVIHFLPLTENAEIDRIKRL